MVAPVSQSQNIVQALTGSSIDIQKLATDLTAAVRAPQQAALDTRKTVADAKISAIGAIMSSASSLQTALAGYGDPKTIAYTPGTDPNASFSFHVGSPARAVDLSFQINNPATVNTVTLAGFPAAGSAGSSGSVSGNVLTLDLTGVDSQASSGAASDYLGVVFKAKVNGQDFQYQVTQADVTAATATTGQQNLSVSIAKGLEAAMNAGSLPAGYTINDTTAGVLTVTPPSGVVLTSGYAGNSGLGGVLGTGSLDLTYTSSTGASTVQSFDLTQFGSLSDLQTAIQNTTGFDAQIVSTGSSPTSLQYLSITHGTGAANIFSVSRSDGSNPTPTDGLQATAGSATSAGVDASISYNGITFTSPTNTFSNFVSDLNITISSSAPVASPTSTPPVSATTVHLTTTDNTSGCQQALSDIVSSYNSLLKTLQTQMTWNSDVTKRGGLANDPIANGLLDQMRLLSTDPITLANGKTVTMADVGVRTNTDGSLEVDTQSLNTAMTNNPGLLESVISSGTSAGALERFSSLCTVITAPTSDLQTLSNTTTNTDLAKIADDETALTTAMTALQAKYLQQFSDMQTIVSSAKSTQDSLTQSMTAWTAGLKS